MLIELPLPLAYVDKATITAYLCWQSYYQSLFILIEQPLPIANIDRTTFTAY